MEQNTRPTWDQYFATITRATASRSPCERLHVGCVIVSSNGDPNRILATGYNGFLPNAPHTSYVRDNHEQATVHAEQNAITDAAKRGIALKHSKAYITHYPCVICAKLLVAAGIEEIIYLDDYKNDPLVEEILKPLNIKIKKLN